MMLKLVLASLLVSLAIPYAANAEGSGPVIYLTGPKTVKVGQLATYRLVVTKNDRLTAQQMYLISYLDGHDYSFNKSLSVLPKPSQPLMLGDFITAWNFMPAPDKHYWIIRLRIPRPVGNTGYGKHRYCLSAQVGPVKDREKYGSNIPEACATYTRG